MTSVETTQNKRPLVLVEPNPRVKLGKAKWLGVLRGQDLVESIGWLSIVWVVFKPYLLTLKDSSLQQRVLQNYFAQSDGARSLPLGRATAVFH